MSGGKNMTKKKVKESEQIEVSTMHYKGVNWTSTRNSDYLNATCATNADQLMSTGANYAAVFICLTMSSNTSNVVVMDTAGLTATDDSIVKTVGDLHARCIGTIFHIGMCLTGGAAAQSNCNPADKAAWFASYGAALNHYAQIAQDNGVEIFSIGTEFDLLDQGNLPLWTALINGVRAIFKGQLIYSAQWYDYTKIPFWDLLDVVGPSGICLTSWASMPTSR